MVNGIDSGKPIAEKVREIHALGDDPTIKVWLRSSRYWKPYLSLCAKLRKYGRQYEPGSDTHSLTLRYEQAKGSIERLKTRLEQLESSGNIKAYNSLIPEYNLDVSDANALLHKLRFQYNASQKLDLEFNKCLDSGTLMSRFQKVDLLSHETEINSLPDPQ